jgi:hypothetical protein
MEKNSLTGHRPAMRAGSGLRRSSRVSALTSNKTQNTKECAVKSFIPAGILAASLALTANAAMAAPSIANPFPHGPQGSHARPPVHVVARTLRPRAQLNVDVAQFIRGMLGGGPVPYANLIRDVRNMPASRGSSASSYEPSYDASVGATVGCAACDAQAASDQEVQEIQQMNDTNALTASMAAAEQQNDAANAAALQTEINAGM